jgi:hypothetical protein
MKGSWVEVLSFRVNGVPKGQPRPVVTRNKNVFTPSTANEWKDATALPEKGRSGCHLACHTPGRGQLPQSRIGLLHAHRAVQGRRAGGRRPNCEVLSREGRATGGHDTGLEMGG